MPQALLCCQANEHTPQFTILYRCVHASNLVCQSAQPNVSQSQRQLVLCRCCLTGIQSDTLGLCTWAADDRTHTLYLTAVQPVLPLIAQAARSIASGGPSPEAEQVLSAANL